MVVDDGGGVGGGDGGTIHCKGKRFYFATCATVNSLEH